MACRLMVLSYYLNQCWLIIKWILWHSPECNFIGIAHDSNSTNEFRKLHFEYYFHISQGPTLVLPNQWPCFMYVFYTRQSYLPWFYSTFIDNNAIVTPVSIFFLCGCGWVRVCAYIRVHVPMWAMCVFVLIITGAKKERNLGPTERCLPVNIFDIFQIGQI